MTPEPVGPIFRLLAGAEPAARRRAVLAAGLIVAAWLAIMAYLAPFVRSPLAQALVEAVPRAGLMAAGAGALALAVAMGLARRRPGPAVFAAMLLAYLTGILVNGWSYTALDPATLPFADRPWVAFSARRFTYLACVVVPLLAVYVIAMRRQAFPGLGGRWREPTRFFGPGERPETWGRQLAGLALVVGVPFFLIMQAAAGFSPIRTGALWPYLAPILVMSVVNAAVEEVIFRGFIQPAAIRWLGLGWGLWLQGAFFGLHHWGLSPSMLGSLPGALLIGLGSVVFGKSVVETGGLGWAIAAHAVFDIGVFAAFFVPGT
jgi:membrane protease YdiL (CAAX protease family)